MILTSDPINWNHSLNRGLVGAWLGPWQQPKGTLVADGCRGSNGRLTSMDATTDWVRGPVRGMRALDFDGSNDRVSIPEVSRQIVLTNFTLWAWIRPDLIGSFPTILEKGDGSTADRLSWGLNSNDSYKTFIFLDSSTVNNVDSDAAPVGGAWSNAAIVVQAGGGVCTHYLNGEANGVVDEGGGNNLGVGQPWNIGARTDGTRPFTGQISEVRIYDRALSAAEIYQLYRLTQREQSDLYNYQPSVQEFA